MIQKSNSISQISRNSKHQYESGKFTSNYSWILGKCHNQERIYGALEGISAKKKASDIHTIHCVDATTSSYIKGDYEEMEVGFIDGLCKLYKF